MDNVPKAMVIAASTLLAVMVMAVMIYAIRHVGILQDQQQTVEQTQQIADFNREYEAYNKKIMYGVDVLSCLNKARSNNEKYVGTGNFMVGSLYPKEYIIDVAFKLKTGLEDRIIVSYLQANTTSVAGSTDVVTLSVKEKDYIDRGPKNNPLAIGGTGKGATYQQNMFTYGSDNTSASFARVFKQIFESGNTYLEKVVGNATIPDWEAPPSTIQFTKNNMKNRIIRSCVVSSKIFDGTANTKSDGYYHLLSDTNGITIVDGDPNFQKDAAGNNIKDYYTKPETEVHVESLLNAASNLKMNVKHTLTQAEKEEANSTYVYQSWDEKPDHNAGWSSAEWRTALYDFKTRKFKCESITVSSITGRVISLVFCEI